ncbi:formate dehydrogenase subunit alpha [Sedimenticola selenatireducens]|uniref:NADH-quinone oxidoreductase subunit G n=1 Tax=Sedimenticola selenatireducens TaxID=191960 RepID=A0A558DP01_9GAMM|nr:formate dehydrogenase subunit alpha [Sedimenticola selenatireducens]TVO78434.1 formate dehydrogenase subunit alpha [Sedimenticola selenatireducens]TVT62708.1 MAG: formate dehydrogenase subunit alpha [Sedimenticola selenatireducens]
MTQSQHPNATAVSFTLNGVTVTAQADESILQVAQRQGIEIPHLCYTETLRADGNCRACVVEIEGERILAPSCCRYPSEGMSVTSHSKRAMTAQKMVLELLQSDAPKTNQLTPHSELKHWCEKLAVTECRFPERQQPAKDCSHPAITTSLDACIQCGRCLRACREEQANDVIGFAGRGSEVQIIFDMADPMGLSSCVACGECVQACPTGAIMPAGDVGNQLADKQVHSVCPYCGVGCQLTYHVKDNSILFVEGRNGPANHNRLCVKGRYGFDYVTHRQRLTKPLIRRSDAPKHIEMDMDYNNPLRDFREASWEEALEFATKGLKKIHKKQGPNGLAGFGSAKGSNEEAYLFQKLIRTAFNTNNVDHCTRLCHASSVAALLQMIGSGAVSNPVADVADAEVIVLIGSNPTSNHPVAATFFKNAARDGKTLIVMDPRKTDIARYADHVLQFNPDTDVAMLNAIMHAIIQLDLVDHNFIEQRTEGYTTLKKHLQDYTPERMAPICGIPAETLYEVARIYASAKGSMIFWGMGVSQHIHGTDNARCLINLALITGQIGRPGCGLHPLRGQNNVQGASDVGLIPMVYPDYQRVDNAEIRKKFEALWQTTLDPNPGLTVVEIMHAIHDGNIQGMYIMGENPAMSDPNLNHARTALASLKHLVVQDIFMTETAHYADVILPASAFPEKTGTFTNTDRRVQMGRQAIDSPGEARQDLDILLAMAKGLGLQWNYTGPRDVFNEMRQVMPSIAGITWERLEAESAVTYPCSHEGDSGESVIFQEQFPRAGGKAALIPAAFSHADELPDDDYPYILITGRQLEHWHTGAMTRRASVLNSLEPEAVAMVHPDLLEQIGLHAGESIRIRSRRGEVVTGTRSDRGLNPGQIFLPFCYYEAAANMLTNDALDPDGKIPEFKFCAIKIEQA